MKILSTYIEGLFIIKPDCHTDERGYFSETFRKDIFENFFPEIKFCQDNESKSSYGTLRGLHFQLPPFAQTKLVRVVRGSVLDVAVDLRKGSSTFGKYFSIIISHDNDFSFYIPENFAHGFLCLSRTCTINYKCSDYRNPKYEKTLSWNDPDINIKWPTKNPILSKRDKDTELTLKTLFK